MKKLAIMAVLAACVGLAQAQPFAAWTKYREVTINTTAGGADVATSQTDFPVLVRLSNTNEASGSNVLSEALAGGADIRFTDETGTVVLSHEIESWSASSAAIWVRVPTVEGDDNTTIRLYWDRSGAPNTSSSEAVFGDNGFLGVWHMGTASGADARVNAASPGTNDAMPAGTETATMNPTAGIIGMSDSLRSQNAGKESDDHFDMGPMTFPDSQITVSLWMLLPDPQKFVNWTHFFTHGNGNLDDNIWMGREGTTTNLRARGATGGGESGNPESTTITGGLADLDTWMHVGVTKDSTGGRRWRVFKDGEMAINYYNADNSHVFVPGLRTSNHIGYSLWSDRNPQVKVDEMRTSSIARSPDWMKLEYETQKAATTAVTLGATVTPPVPDLAYITQSASYLLNEPITANTPVTSSAGSGWSIAPTLPAGLSFNTSNGHITGTPTAVSAADEYVVSATVDGDVVTYTLNIAVTAGTPPAAPTAVTAVRGNAQATVSWIAGAAGTAPITGFEVTAVGEPTKTCETDGELTCVVTGLTNGTSYTFTVQGISSVGTGPASDPSNAVTPVGQAAAPTGVTATLAGNTATVSWTAPTENGGASIIGYHVSGTPNGYCNATAPATSCPIQGLTTGTAYTFRVYAENAAAVLGDTSAPSDSVTPVSLAGSFAIQVTGAVKPYTFALTEEAMNATDALTMSITDVHGRTVWSKTVNPSKDRQRQVTWNGKSSTGRVVSAGVYLVRVSAAGAGQTREIIRPTVK